MRYSYHIPRMNKNILSRHARNNGHKNERNKNRREKEETKQNENENTM